MVQTRTEKLFQQIMKIISPWKKLYLWKKSAYLFFIANPSLSVLQCLPELWGKNVATRVKTWSTEVFLHPPLVFVGKSTLESLQTVFGLTNYSCFHICVLSEFAISLACNPTTVSWVQYLMKDRRWWVWVPTCASETIESCAVEQLWKQKWDMKIGSSINLIMTHGWIVA